MRSLLRVLAVLSSLSLLLLCMGLAQMQAQPAPLLNDDGSTLRIPPPAMSQPSTGSWLISGSKSFSGPMIKARTLLPTLRNGVHHLTSVPTAAPPAITQQDTNGLTLTPTSIARPTPVLMASSEPFSSTMLKGGLLLQQDLGWIGKKDEALQAAQGAGDVSSTHSEPSPNYSLLASGVNAEWVMYSLFQGEMSMSGLHTANDFGILPGVGSTTAANSSLRADVEGAQTLMEVSVRPFGWKELLPDYSEIITRVHDPILEMMLPLLAGQEGGKHYLGSTTHISMSGRMRAWLNTGLAEDFRQFTQDGHHERQMFLTPFLFKNDPP